MGDLSYIVSPQMKTSITTILQTIAPRVEMLKKMRKEDPVRLKWIKEDDLFQEIFVMCAYIEDNISDYRRLLDDSQAPKLLG